MFVVNEEEREAVTKPETASERKEDASREKAERTLDSCKDLTSVNALPD